MKKMAYKKAINGIRTHDLSLTKRVLYQLSYDGVYTFCGDRTHGHWLKRPTLYHLS